VATPLVKILHLVFTQWNYISILHAKQTNILKVVLWRRCIDITVNANGKKPHIQLWGQKQNQWN
jgi:hypothetical protein